jgi:hypothetical protein
MLSFHVNRLFLRVLPSVVFLAAAPLLSAGTVVNYPLPTTDLNQAAGADRTNASLNQGVDIVGDDFVNTTGSSYVINNLTVYAIANSPGDNIGDELSSVSLYTGAYSSGVGDPVTLTATLDQAELTAAPEVDYTDSTEYQTLNSGTPGSPNTTYDPIYALTFTGLNLSILAGQDYYFAVAGIPVSGSYTLSLSASAVSNSSTTIDSFDLFAQSGSQYLFEYGDDGADVTCYSLASSSCTAVPIPGSGNYLAVNFAVNTPEPSTLSILGLGLGALMLKLRRRK